MTNDNIVFLPGLSSGFWPAAGSGSVLFGSRLDPQFFFTGSDQIFIYKYNCFNVHDKIDFSDFYFKAPKPQIWFLKMYTYSTKGVHMFLPLDPDPFKNETDPKPCFSLTSSVSAGFINVQYAPLLPTEFTDILCPILVDPPTSIFLYLHILLILYMFTKSFRWK